MDPPLFSGPWTLWLHGLAFGALITTAFFFSLALIVLGKHKQRIPRRNFLDTWKKDWTPFEARVELRRLRRYLPSVWRVGFIDYVLILWDTEKKPQEVYERTQQQIDYLEEFLREETLKKPEVQAQLSAIAALIQERVKDLDSLMAVEKETRAKYAENKDEYFQEDMSKMFDAARSRVLDLDGR